MQTWALHSLGRGTSVPLLCKQGNLLCAPDLKEMQLSFEPSGLIFGAAYVAAATYSTRRSFKQRRRRSVSSVARAQQVSTTSLPGQNKLWDRLGLGQGIPEPSRRGKGLFQWLSRSDDEVTTEELLWKIAKQRLTNKEFANHVDVIDARRSDRLAKLQSEVTCAKSRRAALLARLKEAQEKKQRLDQQEKVLVEELNALLRENATLGPTIEKQHALLQRILGVLQRCNRSEEDDDDAVHEGDIKGGSLEEMMEVAEEQRGSTQPPVVCTPENASVALPAV